MIIVSINFLSHTVFLLLTVHVVNITRFAHQVLLCCALYGVSLCAPTAEQPVATLLFEGELPHVVPLDLVVLELIYSTRTEVNYEFSDPTQVRSATCSVHCMYKAYC